jgi:hypothetical protein
VLAVPLAVLAVWIGASLLWRAFRLSRRRAAENPTPALLAAPPAEVDEQNVTGEVPLPRERETEQELAEKTGKTTVPGSL